ncbi:MAG: hypothetical protein HYU37_11385 [Acidobacteria bacterium]|nr:hypothetical protein [Acidobacteriota bacterium]
MNPSHLLMIVAVVCACAVSVDAAQRGAGRGAGRAPAPAVRGAAPGPRADRPAQAPKPDRSIAANIAKDPKLEARVKAMLPPGMTLEEASEGFRNQGQFVAALQASKNLDLDFADLKAEMTGANPLTLGEAIQKLKP